MRTDHAAFFDGYRSAFGKLRQKQVDGLDLLLHYVEGETDLDLRWAAYMLATIKHECADTWWPISERGPKAYFQKYEPETLLGQRLGNTLKGDGYRYRGRGYVQITGRANYERLTDRLGIHGAMDLVCNPNAAKAPLIAYQVLSTGMREGLFTGKALKDYLNEHTDYGGARRIVNGLDQSERIAGYAETFEQILKGAVV